ncbi:MAG: type III-A CRISPR-associated protein Cas10/Csm1 [Ignavibacteria bacterium]|nr:type III-A CRISPR-associated protein Cas10/Csm1 [Ignavibacteria bacterium]
MTEREAKYLGAFLHDIGKFTYRAYGGTMGHEDLGVGFFDEHISPKQVFGNDRHLREIAKKSIKRAFYEIEKADYFAASEREKEKKSTQKTRRPLVSILSKVEIGKASISQKLQGSKKTYFYLPDPITLETICDVRDREIEVSKWELTGIEDLQFQHRHQVSYDKFVNELKILRGISKFRPFFATLYKIVEKYTSRVSSASYASSPDISLFDHSRVVAALSVCHEEGEKDLECLLIKGDISGIQNFIYYQIEEAERAAKELRGRSFYVKLLGDTLANYLTLTLEIYDANILFCNGGNFEIIAPNNEKNRTKLKEAEQHINQYLLQRFGGQLQVVMASIQVGSEKLMENYFDCRNQLEFELQKQKRKKSFSVLEDLMLEPKELLYSTWHEKMFEGIGKNIVHKEFLIEVRFPPQRRSGYLDNLDVEIIDFSELGIAYFFAENSELKENLNLLEQHQIDYVIVHNLKDTDLEMCYNKVKDTKVSTDVAYSYKFIGSFIPTDKYRPLTFEELAEIDSKNYPLLGASRLDVDDLGKIIAFGLTEAKVSDEESLLYSISRVATLSREIDLFFCGYINKIAKENDIYLVFAGGDDLFAVGSWTKIIDFAIKVKREFRKFSCSNDNITLSCGTVFFKPSYPTSRFAKAAKEQEERAKGKDKHKDKISIFYREVTWRNLGYLLRIGKILYELVQGDNGRGHLPRSFIHKLLDLTKLCFDEEGKLVIDKLNTILPKLHYAFARRGITANELNNENNKVIDRNLSNILKISDSNIEKYKNKITNFERFIARYFIESTSEERKNWFENFQIPASYVLLKTRKGKK